MTDVGRTIRTGLRWKSLSQVVSQAIRLPVAIVIARTLTPRELGLATMALVIAGIAALTTGFGTDVALVQQKNVTDEDRATVFWTLLAAGALCSLAGAAFAPVAAVWFHDSRITWLFAVAALSFFLSALGATHRAILTRELRFAALETGTIVSGLAGSITVVSCALAGLGAWALVLQPLVALGTLALAAWVQCAWRPAPVFAPDRLRLLAPVSVATFVTRLSLGSARLVDNVIVGRFLGSAALGLYSLAYSVMLLPSSRLTGPVQDVLYPILARLSEERSRLAAIWERSTRALVLLVVPLGIVVLATAPELIRVVFGARWSAAAPLVRVLVGAGILQSFSTGNLRILVAVGRSRSAARFAVAWLVAVIAAVGASVHWGILWVCVAYACATALFTPVLVFLVARALALPLRRAIAPFAAPVVPAVGMAGAVLLAAAATSGGTGAVVEAAAGLAVYGALLLVTAGGFRSLRTLTRPAT